MKTFLQSFAGALAAILLLVLIGVGYGACVAGRKATIEDDSWLVIGLYGSLIEYDPPGGVVSQIAAGDQTTLQQVLDNLRKARVDDRIRGVILKVSAGSSMGAASIQEIRAAVKRLQGEGKPVYGWAESFNKEQYLLLAACDEIVAPPTAYVTFTGLSQTTVHVKMALEKLGIKPNLHKIKDYKSAAELVTRENMSAPSRENTDWMLAEFWDMAAAALAEDRGLDETRIVEIMDHALFTPDEARQAGLIDRIAYWDDVEKMLKDDDDDALKVVGHKRYVQEEAGVLGLEGDRTIAVIHAQGTIVGRESSVNPLLGLTMGHETIIAELRRARTDDDVAAIVFRVDSPGGEGLGSDLMGHEVEVTAAVKPVVVSMVDVAASGGYHISYRATRILANPMTVTGSIGSISGKFNMAEFFDSMGITHDFATRGPKALMNSPFTDYTPEERERFEAEHWAGFNAWLADVAEHRRLDTPEAERLAHGRVWSGRQAAANKLVDEIGDLERAVEVAKELADISADEEVTVAHFPEKKSLFQTLVSRDEVAVAARWAVYRAVREDVAETWRLLRADPDLAVELLASGP